MSNNYYKQKQFIAEVNEQDEVVGKIEKWEAHKKGILHRGYTAIVTFEDQLVLQHRKHPVFDNVFDLSFSSHQLYVNDELQDGVVSVLDGLQREWGIHAEDIAEDIAFVKKVYYKAFDDVSGHYEHEIDYVYTVELNKLPVSDYQYAYGSYILHKNNIDKLQDPRIYSILAPWVYKIIEK